MNNTYWIRVKRSNQTIFLHCELTDTVQILKDRIERLTGAESKTMRLQLGKQALEAHTSLHDCGIEKEDAELFLALAMPPGPNGEEQWEDPQGVMDGTSMSADAAFAAAAAAAAGVDANK